MNHIDIAEVKTPYGYFENYWTIDGVLLPELLDIKTKGLNDENINWIETFLGLCPAWNFDLDWWGDVRFVWKLINMDNVTLPILLCEDDRDFSCIVIVVEVKKSKDFVCWNRIGYVLHNNENFDEEKQNGILNLEIYSDEDWKKYGDNIALAKVDSQEWTEWVGKHWDEELYRRRMNYTFPYYQKEENIEWFLDTNWVFNRVEYENMVVKFKHMQQEKNQGLLDSVGFDKKEV